jgi:hypothetical protein
MFGDEDQEHFYENVTESNDFRKQQRVLTTEGTHRGSDVLHYEDTSSRASSDTQIQELLLDASFLNAFLTTLLLTAFSRRKRCKPSDFRDIVFTKCIANTKSRKV